MSIYFLYQVYSLIVLRMHVKNLFEDIEKDTKFLISYPFILIKLKYYTLSHYYLLNEYSFYFLPIKNAIANPTIKATIEYNPTIPKEKPG